MKKKATNYNTLSQLATFAVGAEIEPDNQTSEELDEFLDSKGIDPLMLEAATLRRVKRFRNQMSAMAASSALRHNLSKPRITVMEMRQVLEEEGQLLAAKAKGSLADEDIEAIYRLTHPEEDGGT